MPRHPGDPWLQLRIGTDQPERIEAALEAQGALAITLQAAGDETLIEPDPGATPLWGETEVCGLFESDADPERIMHAVQRDLDLSEAPAWRAELLEDRDWVRAWLEDYRPIRFGQRLWVCPRHEQVNAPGAVVLRLDPGLAFGTGTHPTTAMCLEWLDTNPPENSQVIDYGCGSGILAVAAALLGADSVAATDIDDQALTASRDNAAENGVAAQVHCYRPADLPIQPADVLLANILAAPLLELAPLFAQRVRARGWIVLSGLLDTQCRKIEAAYAPWFDMQPAATRAGWACLSGRRHHPAKQTAG